MRSLAAALMLAGLAASTEGRGRALPATSNDDGHEASIDYRDGQIINLRIARGRPLTMRLPSGEKIETFVLSETADWQATANRARSRLTISTVREQGLASLAVRTDLRLYTISLSAESGVSSDRPPTSVRLVYSANQPVLGMPGLIGGATGGTTASYRVRGDRALRPSAVVDDGARTYIDWPADLSLPAVYAINDAGREALVNGNMRGGRYVIDSVEKHLVFRIDKRVATADRVDRRRDQR